MHFLIKTTTFNFVLYFSMLSILRRTKKFLPIGKITAHFAHRFFSIQEKFAHYSKNLGCATVCDAKVMRQIDVDAIRTHSIIWT